jgi:hypothetical protein
MDTARQVRQNVLQGEGKPWVDKSDFGGINENQRSFCSGPHLVNENLHYVLTQSPFVLAM